MTAVALRSYWELTKPRLSALAVFAVVAGAFMAWPAKTSSPPLGLLLFTTLGNFLAAAGAGALNMYRERHLDPLMKRTQDRPLPSGRLQPGNVLAFGLLASVLGDAGGVTGLRERMRAAQRDESLEQLGLAPAATLFTKECDDDDDDED